MIQTIRTFSNSNKEKDNYTRIREQGQIKVKLVVGSHLKEFLNRNTTTITTK